MKKHLQNCFSKRIPMFLIVLFLFGSDNYYLKVSSALPSHPPPKTFQTIVPTSSSPSFYTKKSIHTLSLLGQQLQQQRENSVDDEQHGKLDVDGLRHNGRRRSFLFSPLLVIPYLVSASPPASHAVKPRNEALCNTGLFENFLEYRCTAVGNIQDEGYTKELSAEETQSTDSLLSKLGLGGDNDAEVTVDNMNGSKEDGTTRRGSTTTEEASSSNKRK
jgi:hypothetical protein